MGFIDLFNFLPWYWTRYQESWNITATDINYLISGIVRCLLLTLCCCFCRKVAGFLSAQWSQEAGTGPWRSEDLQLGSTSSLSVPHVSTRHGQDQSRPACAPLQLWVLSSALLCFYILNKPQTYVVIYIVYFIRGTLNITCTPFASTQIVKSQSHNLSCLPAFQQTGHPSLSSLPQDSGRLAAVRPMPEPPPLISSSKPGGSITQV